MKQSNRERYLEILGLLNINQVESAKLLSSVSKRPCSPRTVRSWLNDPEKPSSRPCPDWAITNLEWAVEMMLKEMAKRAEAQQQENP